MSLVELVGRCALDEILAALAAEVKPSVEEKARALLCALRNNDTDCMELLLTHGADPNYRFTDDLMCLHRACEHQQVGLIPLLVRHGADVNAQDEAGQTPLHWAIDAEGDAASQSNEAPSCGLTELLIAMGANPFVPSHRGETPYDLAKTYRHQSAVDSISRWPAPFIQQESNDMTSKTDQALADFDAAIQLDPADFQSLYSRSLIWKKQGKWREALADLEAGIKLNPDDFITVNALASALLHSPEINLRNPKRALELATKACEQSEWNDAACVETLAAAYKATGDLVNAHAMTKKAAEIRSDDE